MTTITVDNPFPFFTDVDGGSLEGGNIYVGVAGLDAKTNPVTVYWDRTLVTAALQPIRTVQGYPDNGGSPSNFFADGDFSITVEDSEGALIYSSLRSADSSLQSANDFVQYLSGDGVNREFLLSSAPDTVDNTLVLVEGVAQYKNTYTISGKTLTFSEAPPEGTDNIEVTIKVVTGVLPLEAPTLEQFGAVGDAIVSTDGLLVSGTDDTAAVQAAVDWQQAVPGRVILGDPGAVYLLTTTITGSGKPFSIMWRGAKWFKNGTGNAFKFEAVTQHYDLAADYSNGDLTLTVEDTGTALPPGQPIVIYSDAISRVNRDSGDEAGQYRTGEWAFVGEGTTTTSIVIDRPLVQTTGIDPNDPNLSVALVDEARVPSYSTLLNARITVSDFPEMNWVGGEGQFAEGHGQGSGSIWTGYALGVIGYKGEINGFKVNRGYGPAITVGGCYGVAINNCFSKRLENNTADGQFGYGVTDNSFGTVVRNCLWADSRHGFTTGSPKQTVDEKTPDTLGVPGSIGAVVDSCKAVDFKGVSPFDTHHGAWGTKFVSCHAENCSSTAAFNLRGRNLSIINPLIRNCLQAFNVITEFSSGSSADDLWTAGKETRDRTSAMIVGGDIQVAERLLDGAYSDVSISGHMRVRCSSHVLIEGEMELDMYGSIDFVVDNAEGALAYATDNNKGVFNGEDADNANKGNLLAKTIIKVHKGATLAVDAVNATSTGVSFVNLEASSEFINEGDVAVSLPGGADLFTSTGDVSGSGHIEFSLDGEADNTQTPELVGREVNVDSADETVKWLAEKPGKPLQPLMTDHTLLVIAGTGAEIANAYVPPLRFVVQHMAAQSGGQIQMSQAFFKDGSAGAATLKYDSYGSFQDSYIAAAGDNNIFLEARLNVRSLTQLTSIMRWQAHNTTGEVFDFKTRILSDTYTDLTTEAGTPLDLDPTIAVGDNIELHYTEIKVTSGGYY